MLHNIQLDVEAKSFFFITVLLLLDLPHKHDHKRPIHIFSVSRTPTVKAA